MNAGMTAGTDAAQQVALGATTWEAIVHATVMGGIDYLANKAMLKGFSAVMQGNMLNLPSGFLGNLEKYAVNAIKAFGVGAYTTAQKVALENIADMVLAGDRSRYTALVDQYLKDGMPLSKAQAAAAFESVVKQPLDRSVEGGLMAAAFSVYGTYKNNAQLKANQALQVSGETGSRTWADRAGIDYSPLDEAALRETGAGQRLLTGAPEGAAQPQLANGVQGLLGPGGSPVPGVSDLPGLPGSSGINGLPDIPSLPGLPGASGSYNAPGAYGAAAALKAVGPDVGTPEELIGGIEADGGNSTGDVIEIKLKYKESWTPEQRLEADAKIKALSEAKHVKTKPVRNGTSASSRYKSIYGQNSIPYGYDIDHILDLQLGGADDILNMNPLDMSVNRSLGSQIMNAIKPYDYGTVFKFIISD